MRSTTIRFRLGAIAAAIVVTACGDGPLRPDGLCRGSGGVVFSIGGSLTTASSPFAAGAEVSGCLRIASDAAGPGSVSSEPGDVLGFEVRVGSESWSGDGYTMASTLSMPLRGGGIRFEILDGGTALAFSGASQQPSEPGDFYVRFHDPGTDTTRIVIQSGQSPFAELAGGTVEFTR